MQERLLWQQQTNTWLFPSTSFAQGLNMKNWLSENDVYLCLRQTRPLIFFQLLYKILGPAVKVKEPAFQTEPPFYIHCSCILPWFSESYRDQRQQSQLLLSLSQITHVLFSWIARSSTGLMNKPHKIPNILVFLMTSWEVIPQIYLN